MSVCILFSLLKQFVRHVFVLYLCKLVVRFVVFCRLRLESSFSACCVVATLGVAPASEQRKPIDVVSMPVTSHAQRLTPFLGSGLVEGWDLDSVDHLFEDPELVSPYSLYTLPNYKYPVSRCILSSFNCDKHTTTGVNDASMHHFTVHELCSNIDETHSMFDSWHTMHAYPVVQA